MKAEMEQSSTLGQKVDMTALMETLDYIRPALHADGGDLVYHGVDDEGIVRLELLGACGTCPLSIVTLVSGIERLVLQRVPGVSGVVAHSPVIPGLSGLGE
ncbi:MAG TPA: NifU family protein [Acidimicrobiia bacterium]|jgi:Fe-S cluster biogenesis protein NfuA